MARARASIPEAKGFDDVIVGTKFEANDTIHFVRYVAGHDDWYI